MAAIGAALVILTALFAAPLVLGSYVVVQGASRRLQLAWFGFLTLLFVVALVLGALALLATFL
jgi:hypothetical protein